MTPFDYIHLPGRCQGCRANVVWAFAFVRTPHGLVIKRAWRDPDGYAHRCPDWESRAVAAMVGGVQ